MNLPCDPGYLLKKQENGLFKFEVMLGLKKKKKSENPNNVKTDQSNESQSDDDIEEDVDEIVSEEDTVKGVKGGNRPWSLTSLNWLNEIQKEYPFTDGDQFHQIQHVLNKVLNKLFAK